MCGNFHYPSGAPNPTETYFRVDDRGFEQGDLIDTEGHNKDGRYYRTEYLVDRISKVGEIVLIKGLRLFKNYESAKAFLDENGGELHTVSVNQVDIIPLSTSMEYAVCLNRYVPKTGCVKSSITIDPSQVIDPNNECFAFKAICL